MKIKNLPRSKINLKYFCANNHGVMDLLSYLFGFYLIHLCANNRYAIGLLVEQGW
jgi:hypothetical protein